MTHQTMSYLDKDAVKHITCIGAGVIGSGWVAYFLARGYSVTAYDIDADALARLLGRVRDAWPLLERQGVAHGASIDRITLTTDLSQALAAADFVQESVPERLDLKRQVLKRIDEATPSHVIVASSTSGISMTDMAQDTTGADRFVIGHPFNPPYLVPLVEVVGGKRSAPAAVRWAAEFYENTGKTAVTMNEEVPGFIANRLQEALWREALYMVQAGEATVSQIDNAITAGPGLRWAAIGPFLTAHLAGGRDGIAGSMHRYGPEAKINWTRLQSPAYTEDLINLVAQQCEDAIAGEDIDTLIRLRDQALLDHLQAQHTNTISDP